MLGVQKKQNSGNMNRGVRRCLFGPVDHEALRRELNLKFHEILLDDCRRWNFNFQTDTPLPGRFEWEESPAGGTAAFHLKSRQPKSASPVLDEGRPAESEEGRTDQENWPGIFIVCPAEVTPAGKKRPLPTAKQNAQITDFFVKRRRRSTEGKCTNVITSSTEAALCKALR
ncbi:cyclin-dependent kinase inhibitor 1-like [Vanacampus margaritifer]